MTKTIFLLWAVLQPGPQSPLFESVIWRRLWILGPSYRASRKPMRVAEPPSSSSGRHLGSVHCQRTPPERACPAVQRSAYRFCFDQHLREHQVVQRFLQTHPIEGTVATDNAFAMSTIYAIEATPATVLVSRQGRVAAVCHPAQITAAVLNRLLSDQPVGLPPLPGGEFTLAIPKRCSFLLSGKILPEDVALVRVVMIPTTNNGALLSSPDQVESTGSNLREQQ